MLLSLPRTAFTPNLYGFAGAADGAAGAPDGRPQYPWLLMPYGPNRPLWNVAGVDYRTGIPESRITRLADWRSLTTAPALNLDIPNGHITFNSDFTFDSIDFSQSTSATLRNNSGGASNITCKNCLFAYPVNNPHNAGGDFASFIDVNNATIKFVNCKFDGLNLLNMGQFIYAQSKSVSVTYCWFVNSGSQVVSMQDPGVNETVPLTYQYNLIDNFVQQPGTHRNCLQWIYNASTITVSPFICSFNTTYQWTRPPNTTALIGEMFQIDDIGGHTSWPNAIFNNNTMIARKIPVDFLNPGLTESVSTLVHGNDTGTVTNGSNKNNHFDQTGANINYYPGTMTAAKGWTSSGNLDMVTGQIITPA